MPWIIMVGRAMVMHDAWAMPSMTVHDDRDMVNLGSCHGHPWVIHALARAMVMHGRAMHG